VTGQRIAEALIDTFVDQNAHLRACEQQMFGFLESGDGRFTRHGRKSLQKIFESFSAFQIVEERLDGHTRSAKHRSSAKNIRISDDDAHERDCITRDRSGRPVPPRLPETRLFGQYRFGTYWPLGHLMDVSAYSVSWLRLGGS
jgi:hypothetical protein